MNIYRREDLKSYVCYWKRPASSDVDFDRLLSTMTTSLGRCNELPIAVRNAQCSVPISMKIKVEQSLSTTPDWALSALADQKPEIIHCNAMK
jgi:hypothetical protein